MDEQLLGYLLGALDAEECESLEQRLHGDPKLQADLARLQNRFAPLAALDHAVDPPVGLAERTCRFVFSTVDELHAAADEHAAPAGTPATPPPMLAPASEPAGDGSDFPRRVRWLDLAVAATVFLAASLLLVPALQKSRFDSRVAGCQDNLRQLGLALTGYSQRNHDYFPAIPVSGHLSAAGIYAPKLLEEGYVTTPETFLCAGSPLAAKGHFRVPKLKELLSASGSELAEKQRAMGGSYGYSLGYLQDGGYHPVRNQRRPNFVIAADRPSMNWANIQSSNHDGLGQNVLFEDGRASFVVSPQPEGWSDHVYLNDAGQVAPGIHANDSVIGPSEFSPLTRFTPQLQ